MLLLWCVCDCPPDPYPQRLSGSGAQVELHRRRLQGATLLDITLGHKPIDWNKFWGGVTPIGKLGVSASLKMVNSAWIRLGLFGGGFELNIDNEALAEANVSKCNDHRDTRTDHTK